ncbi:MAG: archaeal proteasome endopeptidase complex subunit beta [Candidatus Aenigmarchaeota archaeon]
MKVDEKVLRKTGTTTVGVICSGAVVLGADQKASMGYLVASKETRKILQLEDHIGMTIAGMVGDALALERYIKAELNLYRLQEGRKIPVNAAAYLIANILYARRYFPYIVQLVVGGYDTAPRLYSFDPSGAVQDEKEYFSTGSGSPMAFGVLEDNYKKGMSVEEAKKVVARAIKAATERDIASGGKGIDIVVIDSRGFRKIPAEEVKKLLK